ncbi:glycine dehydrogenase [Strigomonas culicis]|uniref:Glycine cleavage system P protein n=1 Tax=Strigomonas culicis TaxID=28005 RepID=S9TRU5_9TRYP|nr:glycine dehydrogenase [Strigomonas culicis]|eukprot:EPY19218.1 glycine dehydrogenase [Strigomonas culicis]
MCLKWLQVYSQRMFFARKSAPVPAVSESAALDRLRDLSRKNKVVKNMIGQGFYECIVPPVILRNVLENPMWYTPYTPYQAEISQGRLESLLNFQTMVAGLTKMDYANASLLDHATASAEAMYLCFSHHRQKRNTFFVSKDAFATTVEMVKTRAAPLNINIVVGDVNELDLTNPDLSGILVQSPDMKGEIHDFAAIFAKAKEHGVVCCCGTDLLADTLIKAPGDMGADVVVGSAQRLGTPLGYGGPHAGIFAFRDEFKRITPGRIVGISRDSSGEMSIRMALQTREQHIKRERATSNICTAQALLANMNAFYGVYHGPEGMKQLATQIHSLTKVLAVGLESLGIKLINKTYFDTITFALPNAAEYAKGCEARGINVFVNKTDDMVSISVDETTTETHIKTLLEEAGMPSVNVPALSKVADTATPIPSHLARTSTFMQEAVFSSYQSETELMRYIQRLQRKDYGLTHGMIPLGSCTMKLNPAASMRPLTWPEFNSIHPYAPAHQTQGYHEMLTELEKWLCDVTGMAACSLQPNSGANGEYTGLRAIQAYHESKGDKGRKVCLIPTSAHGTNPASAVLAGLKVVTVKCTDDGRVDMADFESKCKKHAKELSCLMITYPSTYGLCDQDISRMTSLVHEHGGQCYIDGANFNAVAGFSGPAFIGGDVMHLNLHKTFSIPHGGGGPGAGPIVVRQHLAPFLPNSAYDPSVGGKSSFGQVSQAAYGSASILTIPYTLFQMLGTQGVKTCTAYAVLNRQLPQEAAGTAL